MAANLSQNKRVKIQMILQVTAALANLACGIASDDCKRFNILRNYCANADHRTLANRQAGQNQGAIAF
jgi:hypothetical protein